MTEYIVQNILLVYLLEISAAVTGSLFLKLKGGARAERIMVGYLWLVVLVETVGLYPTINYFTDFRVFPFVKGTFFERNFWWFNLYSLLKFPILIYYFLLKLEYRQTRRISTFLMVFLIVSGIFDLLFSGSFFISISAFLSISGTFGLGIVILIYYYEMLKSSRILVFYRIPAFYFSAGILLWHLTLTPLFIYNRYFSLKSPEFVELHGTMLKLINVLLYSLFIAGWIIGIRYREFHRRGVEKEEVKTKKCPPAVNIKSPT